MDSESQIDGRRRFKNTFDGTYRKNCSDYSEKPQPVILRTSKMEYEKKKTVRQIKYCVSERCRSVSMWYSYQKAC